MRLTLPARNRLNRRRWAGSLETKLALITKTVSPFLSTIRIVGILLAFYQVILLWTGYNQINSSG